MSTYRHVRIELFQDVAIVKVLAANLRQRDEIHGFQDEVLGYIRDEQPSKLILDLDGVEFISSEAINALLKIRDATSGGNCKLRLCNLQPAVKEVLKITDLARLFDIHDTLPDAFRGFATFPHDEPWPD